MKIIMTIKKISGIVWISFLGCLIVSVCHAIEFHKFDLLIETLVCFILLIIVIIKRKL